MNYNGQKIKITFPSGDEQYVEKGTSLLELAEACKDSCRSTIVAAKVDNDIKELTYTLDNDCNVSFIDLTHSDGFRIYRRSVSFILIKAVNDLFPKRKVVIQHSISKGLYCEIIGERELDESEVKHIEERMREIANAEIPFVKRVMTAEEAQKIFMETGRMTGTMQ